MKVKSRFNKDNDNPHFSSDRSVQFAGLLKIEGLPKEERLVQVTKVLADLMHYCEVNEYSLKKLIKSAHSLYKKENKDALRSIED